MHSIPKKPITEDSPYKIVFVCLGNICRSPTGEGVFQHIVNQEGLQNYFFIDSAGTSAWHVGEPANSKSRSIAQQHGVQLNSRARKFEAHDLDEFDLIIAMDAENKSNILALAHSDEQRNKVFLMRDFDPNPDDGNVPDPYYGGLSGFERVFQIVKRSSESLLAELKPQIQS